MCCSPQSEKHYVSWTLLNLVGQALQSFDSSIKFLLQPLQTPSEHLLPNAGKTLLLFVKLSYSGFDYRKMC